MANTKFEISTKKIKKQKKISHCTPRTPHGDKTFLKNQRTFSDDDVSEDDTDEVETERSSVQQTNLPESTKSKAQDVTADQPRKSAAQLMRDKKKQTALTLQW